MIVRGVYLKPKRGGPVRAVEVARAIAGRGLEGDCQADPASPRQVLLVDAGGLDALALAPEGLAGNVVIEGLGALPSGTVLRIGDARLRVTFPCEACGKLERVRAGLRRAADGRRGLLARVIGSGELAAGRAVSVEPRRLRPLATRWEERLADAVGAVPAGQVITFAQLARCIGVHPSFVRAFPRVLQRLASAARVVPNQRGHDARWDGVSWLAADEP